MFLHKKERRPTAIRLRQIFKTHGFTKIGKVNGTDCSAPMFSNDDLCITLVVPSTGTIAPPALFAIHHFSVDEQYDVRITFKRIFPLTKDAFIV